MKLTCYQIHADAPELVPGQPERLWMDQFANRHPYRCLPLVLANSSGWEIRSPVSFSATWNGGPEITDIQLTATGTSTTEQLQRWASTHFGGGVLTFHTGFLFRTEPGWDLWVGGSPNQIKDGIQPLVGLVETFWLPFPFTMNWHFTRPGTISFSKDEPFCFIMPVPHQALDEIEPVVKSIQSDPALFEQYQNWSTSRAQFLTNLKIPESEAVKQGWQRDYFQGRAMDGSNPASQHIHRRRLKPPSKG